MDNSYTEEHRQADEIKALRYRVFDLEKSMSQTLLTVSYTHLTLPTILRV